MKWFILVPETIFCIMILFSCTAQKEDGEEKTTEAKISVISFNIKREGDTGTNSWENRRNGCLEMINSNKPDLIGMQEVTPDQKSWLDQNLTDYKPLGKARDGSGKDTEYSLIFYRTDRFTVVENSTFWLSATPDFMSKGWDGACYRICTWAKLKVKSNKQELFFFNTHIDHVGSIAQKQGPLLIRERMKEIAGDQARVILTGDFNMQPANANIVDFSTYMNNLREQFPEGENFSTGTFNSWGSVSSIIDYIWYRNLSPVFYRVVTNRYAGIEFISDHYPIMGEFDF